MSELINIPFEKISQTLKIICVNVLTKRTKISKGLFYIKYFSQLFFNLIFFCLGTFCLT